MRRAYGLAEEQLREIAAASEGTVEVNAGARCPTGYQFEISIGFDGHERVEAGLRVRARERFLVVIPPTFPYERPCAFRRCRPPIPASRSQIPGHADHRGGGEVHRGAEARG